MASENEIRDLVRRVVDEWEGAATGQGVVGAETGRIAIGADHGGFELKQKLIAHLHDQGYEVSDCGTHGLESVDYPDLACAVALQVAGGSCHYGIIIDGAGIGSCMTANKIPGIRAALCYDISSARNSREHNHANVLTLGAGLIGDHLARQIVDTWLQTAWGPGRHARRVEKIHDIEKRFVGVASED